MMTMSTRARVRSALAILATVALATVGLVSPASAAGTGTIRGTVVAPGGLERDGEIDLYSWSPQLEQWTYLNFTTIAHDGTFELTGIEAGTEYTLAYYPMGTSSAGYASYQALGGIGFDRDVKVPAQVVTGTSGTRSVTFRLSKGVRVEGKVNVPDGVTAPVTMMLHRAYKNRAGGLERHDGVGSADTTRVQADGSYVFPYVIPGDYAVSVYPQEYGAPEDHEPVVVGSPYSHQHSSAVRSITKNTVLPTITMKAPVTVQGRVVVPAGTSFTSPRADLYEVDPAGYVRALGASSVAADGSFHFDATAFPGRWYTVRIQASSRSMYAGLAETPHDALVFRAGSSGLTIPDFPFYDSGASPTRDVAFSSVLLRGTPTVGSTLSLRRPSGGLGGSSSTPGAKVSYQWVRDGEYIIGATSPSYTVKQADLHSMLSVRMVVRAPLHRTRSYESAQMLVESGHAPSATVHPVITGTAKVGKALKVTTGSWSVPGVRLERQWLRDGVAISGATGASYVLKAADRGKRLSVRITASAPGRANGVSVTAPSAKVAKGDAAKVKKKPKVTGTKRVGKKLKVSKGTWSLKGVKFSYQWLRNGKKISKATKRTYKLKKKDLGKRISVRVTVKKAGYKNAKFVTKKTSKIKAKKKR